jgi:hypothetical protein
VSDCISNCDAMDILDVTNAILKYGRMVDSVFTRCSSASAPYDDRNPIYDVLILQLFVGSIIFLCQNVM